MNTYKIITIALILILIAGIGYFFDNQSTKKAIYNQNIAALNDTLTTWQNKYGKIVFEKKAFLLQHDSMERAIDKLGVEKLDLKKQLKKFTKHKTVIITKTEFKIDTFKIYIDSLGSFNRQNEFYKIAGVVDDSLKLNTVEIYNDQSIIFGQKQQGLFKSPLITAQITNSNPYIAVKDVQSFTTPAPKKRIHLGLQTGFGITSGLKPNFYVGFGLTYSFLDDLFDSVFTRILLKKNRKKKE